METFSNCGNYLFFRMFSISALKLELSNEKLIRKIDEKKLKQINNGNRQKVVPMRELKQYIEQEWEFVSSLPNGKVILKLLF